MEEQGRALTRRSLLAGAAALGLPQLGKQARAADPVDLAVAKREGRVVVYTSAPLSAAQNLANAFQEKYGIAVELFRTGGVQVLRRFMRRLRCMATSKTCTRIPTPNIREFPCANRETKSTYQ